MSKKKILYVATEVDPFLQLSSSASIVTQLGQAMVGQKCEVRIIMPKFGMINERKNRIHEVQRLYGINIRAEEENISLIVKVASIRKGKIQVYFIDNEELFEHRKLFHDEHHAFYQDNHIRVAFMCKAIWAILKNLGWAPDIIHCFGWPWVFVPLYGKVVYKKMPIFKNTKFLQTYGADHFKHSFGNTMVNKARMLGIKGQDLVALEAAADYTGFVELSKQYADKTTYSFSETHSDALKDLQELDIVNITDDENLVSNYTQLYNDLINTSSK